jgi:phosphoenolpyruvate carboxykinase (ATP)
MNTGSVGGPYGAGGDRPPIAASRAALRGAQSGALREVPLRRHPEYGFLVPEECPGVPAELLDPRAHWRGGGAAYHEATAEMVRAFHEHVNRRYEGTIDREILDAAPRLQGE